MDLEQSQSIEAYLEAQSDKQIDILINNAGVNFLKTIEAVDTATWSRMVQINVTSALRLVQTFAPGMRERGWGRILNISSIFGSVTKESRVAYSMTKAALDALTRSAAVEFGPGGVLVNSVAPGYVDTELTRQNNTAAALAAIKEAIPLRRLAQAAELARVATFLVSEENTYLTGQTIVVDGGFTCK
jgi:3-oxoacyl-[acyl-carrier protein] reductase